LAAAKEGVLEEGTAEVMVAEMVVA